MVGGCWKVKREQWQSLQRGILPAAVPVVRDRRAGVAQGCCREGRTDSAHIHVFSRGAACQLPNVYFELLAADISLDYFGYSIPNCSKGIAIEL